MDVSDQRVPLGQALDDSEITRRHKRFWLLAGLGILLDGFDFFIIGVVNPLLQEQYSLGSITLGLVSCAAIVGAIFGAGFLGPLADKIGRRKIFKYDLWLFTFFAIACAFAPNIGLLIVFRFMVGVAIGLDYPISASYLSEILPKKKSRTLAGRSVQSSSGRNTAGGSDRTNHPFSDFGRSRGKHFDRPNKHRLASHVGFWSDSCFGDYFCTAKNS